MKPHVKFASGVKRVTYNGKDYTLRDPTPEIPWYKGGIITWWWIDRRVEKNFRSRVHYSTDEAIEMSEWEYSLPLPYWMRHPFREIKRFWRWLQSKAWYDIINFWQRGRNGFARYDLYNFDSYMVDMWIKVLPEYLNTSGQHIMFTDKDMYQSLYAQGVNLEEEVYQKQMMDEWDRRMTEVIDYLKEYRSDDDMFVEFDWSKMQYFMDNFQGLWL